MRTDEDVDVLKALSALLELQTAHATEKQEAGERKISPGGEWYQQPVEEQPGALMFNTYWREGGISLEVGHRIIAAATKHTLDAIPMVSRSPEGIEVGMEHLNSMIIPPDELREMGIPSGSSVDMIDRFCADCEERETCIVPRSK